MKKSLLYIALFLSIPTGNTYAQFTATWALTVDKSVTVTGAQASSVVALPMVPGTAFAGGAHSSDGFACGYSTTWPMTATDGLHLDFPISPSAESNVSITGLTMGVKTSGSSGSQMFALAYQIDGAGSWTSFGTPQEALSGGSSTLNFGALSAAFDNGHTYVIRMYIYAKASGTSSSRKVYVKNVAFAGSATSANTPMIITSVTALPTFGKLVAGISSESKSFIAKGRRLISDVIVKTKNPFLVSSNNAIFDTVVTLTQSGGTNTDSIIYVKCTPSSPVGTIAEVVSIQSAGAVTKNISVDATILAVEPTLQSAISFGTITGNTIIVNATGGNGAKRIIVIRPDNPVTYLPTDGVTETGVDNNYSLAADKGNGNKVIFDGNASTVTVSGLTSGKTYFVASYEYNEGVSNSQNYQLANPGTGSASTLAVPGITVSRASIAFGSVVVNTASVERTYTISASYLTPASGTITITAPSGFEISATSGTGYDVNLNLPYSNGALNSTTVYARFKPTAIQSYGGNINHAGGGADPVSITVTGAGVQSIPNHGRYDYIVAKDGSGDFVNIQDALDALPANNVQWVAILIKKGTYNEHVAINKAFVALVGESRDSTRIELDLPRSAWNATHGTNTGCGVMNVATNDSNIVIANMTIINTHTSGSDYTEAFRSENGSTKIWVINCTIWATYSDTFSPWGKTNGRYYAANCSFKGGIDAVCPRGWCYMIDCEFIECMDSSPIWHEGIAGLDQKFVIQNGYVRSTKNAGIKLQNSQGSYSMFFYLDCLLSDSVAQLGSSAPAYFWNCKRKGTTGNASWFATNTLSQASGSPSHTDVNAAWVFNGAWDPENTMPSVLQYASLPQPFNKQYDVTQSPQLKWTAACGAISYNVYFGTTTTPPFIGNQTGNTFAPGALLTGQTYYWRVDKVDSAGIVPGFLWQFTVEGTVAVKDNDIVPEVFSLEQNYPNPFNPTTTINYQIPKNGLVSLIVYDALGREVQALVNEEKARGKYSVEFDAGNFPSGVYFYTLRSGDFISTKKLIILK